MPRILEPEVMDSPQEALEYDGMDFREVNGAFARAAISLAPKEARVLDAGTGTARIPILILEQRPGWIIIGIDLAESMLEIGASHIKAAGLQDKIHLEKADAKLMPYPDAYFDLVISNSLVHHLPDPLPFLREVKRVLKPEGGILLRDLLRPTFPEEIEEMVTAMGSGYSPRQQQLFRDSLHAALTLSEIQNLLAGAGLTDMTIYQSSVLHWTAAKTNSLMTELG